MQMMFRDISQHRFWAQKLLPQVQKMANYKLNSEQIMDSLSLFEAETAPSRSYYWRPSTFYVLHRLYHKDLPPIYSQIARFVLDFQKSVGKLEVQFLQAQQPAQIRFNKKQIIYLLCLMSLMLVLPLPCDHASKRFHYIRNFSDVFSEVEFKTLSIIEYLRFAISEDKTFDQKLFLRRKVVNEKIPQLIQKLKGTVMGQFKLCRDQADIEHHYGTLKVDFSNRYLGGGALNHGAVQEEIMFANHPTMYTAMLLCEAMDPNESIEFEGYQKHFTTSGYASSVRIEGLNPHKYSIKDGVAQEYIVAIDSINFSKVKVGQFSEQSINRQILKAYCGFQTGKVGEVTTGNWGCGVFGGDLQLKFVIQWIAASLAGKKMNYCPFGKSYLFTSMKAIEKFKVAEVYEALIKCVLSRFPCFRKTIIEQLIDRLLK